MSPHTQPRMFTTESATYRHQRQPLHNNNNVLRKIQIWTPHKVMIQQQVHLQLPCYDFCPVQATAIKLVSIKVTEKLNQRSPNFSKGLSPGQRRAVCTKGRDVINASWWLALTWNSAFTENNCNFRSQSRQIFNGLPTPFAIGQARWFCQCSARAAPDI